MMNNPFINIDAKELRNISSGLNTDCSNAGDIISSLRDAADIIQDSWVSDYTADFVDNINVICKRLEVSFNKLEKIAGTIDQTAANAENTERRLNNIFNGN